MSKVLKARQDIFGLLEKRKGDFVRTLREKGCDLPSASVYRNAAYRLSPDTLAYDSDGADGVTVDEQKMTSTHVITTPRRDRYGDVVIPRGCEPHLANFAKNPRVFFAHRSNDLPIGSARDEDGAVTVRVEDSQIISTCHYHGATAESNIIFALVKNKELQSTSIGFVPVVASVIEDNEGDDLPRETEEGEDLLYLGGGWLPLRFLEWDMIEWSIVPVPANPDCVDAITSHLSKGHVGGEKLTPTIRKALEPFALKARVWCHGFDPTKTAYTGALRMGDSELEYTEGKLVRIDDFKLAKEDTPTSTPKDPSTDITPVPTTTVGTLSADDTGVITKEMPPSVPDEEEEEPSVSKMDELCSSVGSVTKMLDEHCSFSSKAHTDFSKNFGEYCALSESRHKETLEAVGKLVTLMTPKEEPKAVGPTQEEFDELVRQLNDIHKGYEKLKVQWFELTGRRVGK